MEEFVLAIMEEFVLAIKEEFVLVTKEDFVLITIYHFIYHLCSLSSQKSLLLNTITWSKGENR